jgi:hypothetical protein
MKLHPNPAFEAHGAGMLLVQTRAGQAQQG